MSSRRKSAPETDHATQLRNEIQDLKNAQSVGGNYTAHVSSPNSGGLTFEDLTPVEQACASLGAAPEALRPLGWLNAGHFENLMKSNQMDDELVRRLEAYKQVASRETA